MVQVGTQVLMDVVLALALGALVGLERERARGRKYAGLRTLSLLCGAGPIAVYLGTLASSVLPMVLYIVLGGVFSLLVIYLRMAMGQEDIGLTTSATVFLLTLVGVLVGYAQYFEAVSITLLAVLLLSEKQFLTKWTGMLEPEEISDAAKLGILAFVLYPILPEGAVDPWNVLFLREALLFVLFILLIQFAAFLSLQWLRNRASFILSAGLGGVVSSLAVVSTMAHVVRDEDVDGPAYAGAVAASAAMVVKNAFLATVLAPALFPHLAVPFLAAGAVGGAFMLWYYRNSEAIDETDFGEESPFSFRTAFKFGVLFLAILMVAELSKTYLSISGVYATGFIGGAASSTAVVASAATLLAGGSLEPAQAAIMVALGVVSSLASKLAYTEWGGARPLTLKLLPPYLLMIALVLAVAL